ncbi:phosphatidylinositol N-acetylglucosaminyltransferase subunit H-like isoform X2 [Dysidea avara]|uniref:phosphatidylinositol N-acetylglucosaminyltransferase subunit H-like isoform X2 n=1 Tax=Dysidea avara TaxID=196820 RepID=UPI00332544F8
MTDDNTDASYGLNGEKLTCRIIRYHDAEIGAGCLRVGIFQSGKSWALIRTVAIVTGLLITVNLLFEVWSIVTALTILISCFLLWRTALSSHKGSVLLVPGVGVQVSTTFTCGYSQCEFYPWKIVSNVIVNEVFTMYHVVFCLAILLGDNDVTTPPVRIIPLFTGFNPRLPLIRQIYCSMKEILFSNKKYH